MGEVIRFPVNTSTVALNEAEGMFQEAAELMKSNACHSLNDLSTVLEANELYVEATNRIMEVIDGWAL